MLAYIDAGPFGGFIPCRALARTGHKVKVKLTATRGPYKRGEIMTTDCQHVLRRPLYRSRQSTGRLIGYVADTTSLPAF